MPAECLVYAAVAQQDAVLLRRWGRKALLPCIFSQHRTVVWGVNVSFQGSVVVFSGKEKEEICAPFSRQEVGFNCLPPKQTVLGETVPSTTAVILLLVPCKPLQSMPSPLRAAAVLTAMVPSEQEGESQELISLCFPLTY